MADPAAPQSPKPPADPEGSPVKPAASPDKGPKQTNAGERS